MNEADIDLPQRSSDQAESSSSETSDDRLLTTRLPPIGPPQYHYSSAPPSSLESQSSRPPPASFAPSGAPYRQDVSVPSQPRTSWWRALLTATVPPPMSTPIPTDDGVLRRRIAATCAGMALGFVILALALGLRGAEPASSVPAVSAAVIIARAGLALGFLAFGHGLLRMSERFFMGRSSDAGIRGASPPNIR
jgi:hypothetical protein